MGALTRTRRLAHAGLAGVLLAGGAAVVPLAAGPVARAEGAACTDDSAHPGGVHPGGEWRSYGHDPSNTRHQAAEQSIGPVEAARLEPVWTLRTSEATGDPAASDITGTPAVADGCVYVGTNNGWVIAANADTGEAVWATRAPRGGLVNGSVTVTGGRVFAAVSRGAGAYVVAIDQASGDLEWASVAIDTQPGSDVFASPVVHDGVVMVGSSAGSAELGDEDDRFAFQGSMNFLDADTGAILHKTWTIHPPVGAPGGYEDDYAGGAIWSTPAVDPVNELAYVGSGNPFKAVAEHPNTNAVLAFDVDWDSPTAYEIVGSYKGDVDEYIPQMSELPCIYEIDGNPPPWYPQGLGSCGDIDMDFGASPNLFPDPDTGRMLVGTGQKSGVYHAFEALDRADLPGDGTPVAPVPAWKQLVGPPTPVGGIVGSTAYDGNAIYGPVTVPGYVWSLHPSSLPRWVAPIGDGVHWGNPVAVANGVVYTMDFRGFLDAYDAATGAPLLHRSVYLGSDVGFAAALSWAGVSVARNTVYGAVGIQGLPEGFVVAFRPSESRPVPPIPDVSTSAPVPPVEFTAVAGPGATIVNYATPAIVVPQGSSITFHNTDPLGLHDFDSPKGACGPETRCWPDTELAGPGGSYDVEGIPALAPGSYQFVCSIHARMVGTLTIV